MKIATVETKLKFLVSEHTFQKYHRQQTTNTEIKKKQIWLREIVFIPMNFRLKECSVQTGIEEKHNQTDAIFSKNTAS